MRRPQIDLVYFNAGGGHRAAALALEAVIAQQRRPWDVRLVNLSQVLDAKGSLRRWLGFDPEDFYNKRLQRGWTLGLAQELKLLQAGIRLAHAPMLRTLQRHWAANEPDLVVSLVPNFNRVLQQSVASSVPGTPFVTVMTDLADLPPHFWIEPGQDPWLVCGSERALAQARAAGYADERLFLTSGMPLRPAFYGLPALQPEQRALQLRRLGLDPARRTAVVMFGGQGSAQMKRIARLLDGTQLLLLCGRNEALATELRALRRGAPQAVFGFTEDIPALLRLGDFFIGKPGPGSLSEALHLGLPVITLRNAWTMPQERYNTEWLQSQGVGVVLRSLRALPQAVHALQSELPAMAARARALDNRAVFELPEIFDGLLRQRLLTSGLGWRVPAPTRVGA